MRAAEGEFPEKDAAAGAAEESLDPQDWSAMRALGHRMVDDMMTYLESVRTRPVWKPVPEAVKERLRAPLPRTPEGPERTYEEFREVVLPHAMGNIHPRFWGWVIGTGTPFGMLAEMLAAGMNSNCGGYDQGATYVEEQVIAWCREMLGYPADASGLLVSGGSMANLVGMAVGRNGAAGFDVRRRGVRSFPADPVIYASSETHYTVRKAVEILGLGSDGLREIPVDAEFRIDVQALERAVAADRAAGRRPLMIVGNAGTVNTGAIDDLAALADIAAREKMWYHVDGAFGALVALDAGLRPRLAGMERADSLAFDLHKWMYMPYEIGVVLVRDRDIHRGSFAIDATYLAKVQRGFASGPFLFTDYGLQLSRGFRALKAWMSMKEHGVERYARLIRQNVEQAAYLARLVDDAPDLERLAPASLNIVCYRWVGDGSGDLDERNKAILGRLHEDGIALPSYTVLGGKFAIRCAITNHRSRREDFDVLVRESRRLGRELST